MLESAILPHSRVGTNAELLTVDSVQPATSGKTKEARRRSVCRADAEKGGGPPPVFFVSVHSKGF
jgi:hypothetical protein